MIVKIVDCVADVGQCNNQAACCSNDYFVSITRKSLIYPSQNCFRAALSQSIAITLASDRWAQESASMQHFQLNVVVLLVLMGIVWIFLCVSWNIYMNDYWLNKLFANWRFWSNMASPTRQLFKVKLFLASHVTVTDALVTIPGVTNYPHNNISEMPTGIPYGSGLTIFKRRLIRHPNTSFNRSHTFRFKLYPWLQSFFGYKVYCCTKNSTLMSQLCPVFCIPLRLKNLLSMSIVSIGSWSTRVLVKQCNKQSQRVPIKDHWHRLSLLPPPTNYAPLFLWCIQVQLLLVVSWWQASVPVQKIARASRIISNGRGFELELEHWRARGFER